MYHCRNDVVLPSFIEYFYSFCLLSYCIKLYSPTWTSYPFIWVLKWSRSFIFHILSLHWYFLPRIFFIVIYNNQIYTTSLFDILHLNWENIYFSSLVKTGGFGSPNCAGYNFFFVDALMFSQLLIYLDNLPYVTFSPLVLEYYNWKYTVFLLLF